ncbi:aspartate kinase [Oceanivirga salmonicida]|uniref:aspartate kinase n=1 Tax=Oceanivirga salmonicida TaxID=1769291 RepID=UPI0012E32062|nr:aspartate kinase [Oceanivirga salmonicida]
MLVYKYGGSSVADTKKIMAIASYLKEVSLNDDIVVVVSAMGKTTNNLINLANEITNSPSGRELDRLMSTGENQTIALLSMALNSLGLNSISMTGEQLCIKTKGVHTKSRIHSIDKEKLEKKIKEHKIVIVAGFQGINEFGDVTTLGRGGSDTTAVAIAATLNCPCYIFTDVDGIYSIDPRIYSKAKKLDKISYEEMMELAYLGAGVMEPRAVELGYKYKVPIYVSKSLSKSNGTLITFKEKKMEEKDITGISINDNTLMVTVDNISTYAKNLEPIFSKAEKLGINIDVISHNDVISENGSIAFTTPKTDIELVNKLFSELDLENATVVINKEVSKVSLVGIGMISHIGIMSKIFKILARNSLSFHQISTSEISISLIVDEEVSKVIAGLLAQEFKI